MAVAEVEMLAFGNGEIRQVTIPDAEWTSAKRREALLELVFYYGQNDFQPQPMPSVSVDDVIRLDGERFRVDSFGFSPVV